MASDLIFGVTSLNTCVISSYCTVPIFSNQRTLKVGEVLIVSSLTGLDLTKQENMRLFVFTATTESKPVIQETSCTVVLSPLVSVLWSKITTIYYTFER